MSSALIFDEFEEEPFTENRRWRDSELKIHTHLQTAMDFVGVNAIVTSVCRSGQHHVWEASWQRLESSCGFLRFIVLIYLATGIARRRSCRIPDDRRHKNPKPRTCFGVKLFLFRCFSCPKFQVTLEAQGFPASACSAKSHRNTEEPFCVCAFQKNKSPAQAGLFLE